MKHRSTIAGAMLTLMLIGVLMTAPGCTKGDPPLPGPENVVVERGPCAPENDELGDTLIVSWDRCTDPRVEGYAIFRAEQGIGSIIAEKTSYELQAITIATRYVDDEVRTTLRYPIMRYFYQVAVISTSGELGPVSEEVSFDYEAIE